MTKSTPPTKTSSLPTEGKGLILLGFSLLVLLSLFSFQIEDPGKNWLGLVGW